MQQQKGNKYRDIKIADNVKLYKKDGSFNKQVKDGLDVLVNLLKKNGHVLLSEYKGVKEKLLIDYNCTHDAHLVLASSYKQGSNCPNCEREKRSKRAREEFPLLVRSNGHVLLTPYGKNNTDKVLIDFNCGHPAHSITPADYKRGYGCPECGRITTAEKRSKQTREEFPLYVESNGHVLLTPYGKNNTDKVLIDFKCGHEPHWIEPSNYKCGKRCPSCAQENNAEIYSKEAREEFPLIVESNGHILLSSYGKNGREKVLIDFKCGHEPYWITPESYKSGTGCGICGGTNNEQAKVDFISSVVTNGHILLSEYKTAKIKILVDFQCGHEPHWIAPTHYKSGKRCPNCSESKGEKIIREWMELGEILFEPQYIFPDDAKKYDFMLPVELAVVEVQGIQHYEESYFAKKGGRTLKEEQENDKAKREFAESKGYKYIEVDYREHNPHLALERFIQAYNQLKVISTVT
ncbi:hypothetical protein [Bacillus salipaludis]|uniref:hypothetical protein n=1 Tax=Bacillus salipaludis TaxID=2547811 RepID=UPI002E206739|nr:hypothetical protein [Bacillus salipaludis]